MKIDFFNYSTLTPEQKRDRVTGVGGSDVRDYILPGRWAELYDLKTGAAQEKSLAFEMAPMLGIYLEPFHRAWYEHTTQRPVYFDALAHQTHRLADAPFCLAHIDGYERDDNSWFPWEGKAVNGFTKFNEAIDKYMPQLQWIMFVTGTSKIRFSCLLGNSSCQHELVPADTAYQMKLFDLVATFWRSHMETGVRPAAETPVVVPPQPAPPGEPIIVSMEGNNEWPGFAEKYLANVVAHAEFQLAAEQIKAACPAGAGLVFGNGIKVTINKKGAKSISAMDDKDTKMLPNHPRLHKYTDLVGAKK